MNKENGWSTLAHVAKALVALLPLLLAIPGFAQGHPVLAVLLASPSLLYPFTVAYAQWPWFRLWANRTWLWLTNAQVTWSMRMEAEGDIGPEAVTAIAERAKQLDGDIEIWARGAGLLVLQLPRMASIRIRYMEGIEPNDGRRLISCEAAEFAVPFRDSNKALDYVVDLFDKAVLGATKPTGQKFTFQAKFGASNTYYGLFLNRIDVEQIASFECCVRQRVGLSEEMVQVSEDRVSVVTDSLQSLRTLAQQYITLSSFSARSSTTV